jgi:hypothetical protein
VQRKYTAVVDNVTAWLLRQSLYPKWDRLAGSTITGNVWTFMIWRLPVLVQKPGMTDWSFVACFLKEAPNGDVYVKYYEKDRKEAKDGWAKLKQEYLRSLGRP